MGELTKNVGRVRHSFDSGRLDRKQVRVQAVHPQTNYKDEQEVALGKQNAEAACPSDKLGFKFFSSPE